MFAYIKKIFLNKDSIDVQKIEKLNDQEPELVNIEKNIFGLYIDDFVQSRSIDDLVGMYRDAAQNSEVENAIDEICNESIIVENNSIVSLFLDSTKFTETIKKKINDQFEEVLTLLDFNNQGYELFKKWFIEGRLYIYLHLNENNKKEIVGYEILEPEKIKKIKKDGKIIYRYEKNEKEIFEIDSNLIIFIHSGITDPKKKYYISYLHKSLKPLNQLRLLEDSTIIYRITRAPERRVFYIDVGKMSKIKADAYILKMMNRFKNKISYDIETGKLTNQKNVMTMLEDFYFPITEGGRGTKVDTLASGQQLTDMQDIFYFKKKLYKSLKIPSNRYDDDNPSVVELGRSGEITREELKFTKFKKKLQQKFGLLLFSILKRKLIWSAILNQDDWNSNIQKMFLVWNSESYFTELKNNEILSNKIELLNNITEFVGKYYSKKYVYKHILKFNDNEIQQIEQEINEEKSNKDNKDE